MTDYKDAQLPDEPEFNEEEPEFDEEETETDDENISAHEDDDEDQPEEDEDEDDGDADADADEDEEEEEEEEDDEAEEAEDECDSPQFWEFTERLMAMLKRFFPTLSAMRRKELSEGLWQEAKCSVE